MTAAYREDSIGYFLQEELLSELEFKIHNSEPTKDPTLSKSIGFSVERSSLVTVTATRFTLLELKLTSVVLDNQVYVNDTEYF